MPMRTRRRRMTDTYFRLVREFPLVHLQDAQHAQAAQSLLDRLLEERLDDGGRQYLEVLTDLLEAYENEQEPKVTASEADVLQELTNANGLSQSQLAKIVGISQSTISAVLAGVRSLTKEQIIVLARHFRVSPVAFLPD